MAKRTSTQRRRLARKKGREFKAAVRGEGKRLKVRNPMVVALILRNGSGSHGDARSLLSELNITHPTGYSHSRDPVAQYGVTAMPTTVFFTPDGKVFRTTIGFIDEVRLERSIQNLLTASATSS